MNFSFMCLCLCDDSNCTKPTDRLLYLSQFDKSKRPFGCIWGNTKCIWVYFIHLFRILSIAVMFSLMCILSPQSTVASLHIPSAPPCALSWQDLDVVFMRQVWPVSSSRHVASRGKPPEVDRWLHTRPAASFCALNATQQQCGGHITTHYPQLLWVVELLKGEGDVHIILGINCTTLHHTVPLPASRLKQGGGGSSIFSVFHYKVVLFYLHPALTLICLTRLIKQKTSRSSYSQPIPAGFTKRYNDPHMWASLRSYLSWSVRHLKIQNIFIF